MSADPDTPVAHERYSGGHVMKTVWYTRSTTGSQLQVLNIWDHIRSREWNQWLVPPSVENMHREHPCLNLNDALLKCSDAQPEMMKLAGRCAICNDERQKLMVCLTRNKAWKPVKKEAKLWYQLW